MTDTTLVLVALGWVAAMWALWRLVAALRTWRSVAGVRLVKCPETGNAAAVSFGKVHAAATALLHNDIDARLASCSRWAVRGRCDQPCVPQAKAPDSALTNVIARWSSGRRCALCGKVLVDAPLVGHHISLRSSEGVTAEWPCVRAETLPDALQTCQPVCWDCHVAETFRHRYPELVTDRQRALFL